MSKLEQLLSIVEPELLDRLVPLTTLGKMVIPELLRISVGRSRVYIWPDNGLETISTNGDGTGQLFTTRRWVLEFWTGEKSSHSGALREPQSRDNRTINQSSRGGL